MNALENLERLWTRYVGHNEETKSRLLSEKGIDLDLIDDIQDDENYFYFPLQIMVAHPDQLAQQRKLLIILGDDEVITVQDSEDFPPFESLRRHIKRHQESTRDSKFLTCLMFHVLNEGASKVISGIGKSLEQTSDDITEITGSLNNDREVGVMDISGTMIDLNYKENLISRCLESQLGLARATRYLDAEISDTDKELQSFVYSLRDDINGVKEHASFEHDTVRYLQNAVLASLNVKQNQIVKVFTIITAVFLPPTLIATFYGMNFSVMPELRWEHGFTMSICLTLVAAILPLVYIKRKGWLR